MTPARYKAVLFDFDGVLAETMEDHFRAWRAAMRDVGVAITEEDYFPLEGMDLKEIARVFSARSGLDPAHADEIVKKKEEYYLQDHAFRFYPSVPEFIDELNEKKILLGLVSAGYRDRLEQSLPPGFLRKFDVVVTGDAAGRGKPFPDPYENAARELGIDIKACIVVENAPFGIEAAKRAGAYCVAICSTVKEEHLQGADEIISEFKDLRNVPAVRSLLKNASGG